MTRFAKRSHNRRVRRAGRAIKNTWNANDAHDEEVTSSPRFIGELLATSPKALVVRCIAKWTPTVGTLYAKTLSVSSHFGCWMYVEHFTWSTNF